MLVIAFLIPASTGGSATVVAEPGEAGLRAAPDAVDPGDTILLNEAVELASTVPIAKAVTIKVEGPQAWRIRLAGSFDGALLHVLADDVVIDGLRISGSPVTDGLWLETDVTRRACGIASCRNLVVVENDFWDSTISVRLEGVTVTDNLGALNCPILWATE